MSAKLANNALTTLEDVKIMLGIAPDDVDAVSYTHLTQSRPPAAASWKSAWMICS